MSKKKNIIYKPYIETKTLINSIVYSEIFNFEEAEKNRKIIEIRAFLEKFAEQQARLRAQEEKEKAEKEAAAAATSVDVDSEQETVVVPENNLNSNNSPVESISVESIAEDTSNVLSFNLPENTELVSEQPKEDSSEVFEELITQEEVDALPTEFDIEADFNAKINSVNSLYSFERYERYLNLFLEFDFLKTYDQFFPESQEIFYIVDKFYSQKFSIDKNLFNVKLFLFIEDYLFSNKLQTIYIELVRKFKKKKLKKWKFKKRKLRKLYILKKMKKVIRFRRYKCKHFKVLTRTNYFWLNHPIFKKSTLMRRIPITDRLFSQHNVEFFYKLNKKADEELQILLKNNCDYVSNYSKKLTIYLRNYHQKPYWKFRKARRAHWSLFFNKTIRKQRYGGFLKKFMKKYHKLTYTYTFFVNFFTRFKFSWTKTHKLETFCKNLLIFKTRDIVKLPIFFSKFLNWKFLKKKHFFLKKKVGRWSFLNFKRATQPWLQRKKNAPKQVKHIQPNAFFLRHVSYWDISTGCLYLTPGFYDHLLPVLDDFKVNFLIKLHMYRYKSNKTCMLL